MTHTFNHPTQKTENEKHLKNQYIQCLQFHIPRVLTSFDVFHKFFVPTRYTRNIDISIWGLFFQLNEKA